MDLGLEDRVYVLTGASRGLGYATAQALVADGARVVISARDPDRVAAAAKALGGAGQTVGGAPAGTRGEAGRAGEAAAGTRGEAGRAVGVAADLADPQTPARLVAAATEAFGRLDGALISVGGPTPGNAAQLTDEAWRAAFETVYLGTVRAARTVADALTGGGAIALVLSVSVRSPVPGLGLSNGLRPGLAGFAKDLSDEYGPRGVRVVSLLPGRILTDRLQELFAAAGDPERARAEVEAAIPLGRIGEPAELGRVAAFLLSPAASYLTGITVPVDGGALRTI